MLNALIIDDEQHCIDRLSDLLADQNEIVKSFLYCNTVLEGIQLLDKNKIDVVFLDVQLQNETGFDLLKKIISTITFEVIFTTAHDKYAVEAFKYAALDYLLKPIDVSDLKRALTKLKAKTTLLHAAKKVETLLYNLNGENKDKIINLTNSEGVHRIRVKNILRCKADDNYTHIYFNGHKKITIAKTLKYFENLLEPYSFFRTHQSHLVNLLHVKRFLPKKRLVLLSDTSEIEVSVRKKEALIKILKSN